MLPRWRQASTKSRRSFYAELRGIVSGGIPGSTSAAQIFVFDSTGMAVEDLATADLVFSLAAQDATAQRFDPKEGQRRLTRFRTANDSVCAPCASRCRSMAKAAQRLPCFQHGQRCCVSQARRADPSRSSLACRSVRSA
ncbi:MAG: hypothetical protein JNN30_11380 [Rhodanobacteraceae bacterium]|nr:hypothetical protein [Rhodanobacteraceae bacterium]